MESPFKFTLLTLPKTLSIQFPELACRDTWDHLFYRGEFLSQEIPQIRCITACPQCYLSWFDLPFTTFSNQNLADLVKSGHLTHELIREKGLAEFANTGQNQYYYKTRLGCPANYALVRCDQCQTRHFMVLGLTETQPGLYAGQLHGIWRIKQNSS
ncbi:MAG: hypothetical protein H6581_13450 [Bacteroidia bacterium]|nr:hypothetical protein [Bacteroidia bacterium]